MPPEGKCFEGVRLFQGRSITYGVTTRRPRGAQHGDVTMSNDDKAMMIEGIEGRLLEKIRASECSGRDALDIGQWLIERIEAKASEGEPTG